MVGSDFNSLAVTSQSSRTQRALHVLSKAIGRLDIEFESRDGRRYSSCTCALVGSNIVITNEHCIRLRPGNRFIRASVVFDYYEDSESAVNRYEMRRVISSDPELDYALLELVGNPSNSVGRFIPLARQEVPVERGDQIIVIGHPEGRKKSFSTGRILREATIFEHNASTLPGSSGSLIFSVRRRGVAERIQRSDGSTRTGSFTGLIGIHHSGGNVNRASSIRPIICQNPEVFGNRRPYVTRHLDCAQMNDREVDPCICCLDDLKRAKDCVD